MFYLWERVLVPGMRLDEAQSWSGHFGRDKNLLHLPEFEPKPIALSLY
jgi:hypothetical protein